MPADEERRPRFRQGLPLRALQKQPSRPCLRMILKSSEHRALLREREHQVQPRRLDLQPQGRRGCQERLPIRHRSYLRFREEVALPPRLRGQQQD